MPHPGYATITAERQRSPQGTTVLVTARFYDSDGDLVSPSSVVFRALAPDGSVLTATYGASVYVDNPSTGVYGFIKTLSEPGAHSIDATGVIDGYPVVGTCKLFADQSPFTGSEIADTQDVQLQLLLNVRMYGAVGDGLTDDTSAIQDAVDAATSSNLPLWFPNGEYLISSNISWSDQLDIYGAPDSWIMGDARFAPNARTRIDGLGFKDSAYVSFTDWSVKDIFEAHRCRFKDTDGGFNFNKNPASGVGFTAFNVLNCWAENLTAPFVRNTAGEIDAFDISHNRINTIVSRGIQVGSNAVIYPTDWQSTRTNGRIAFNSIDGMAASGIGIIDYCTGTVIVGNTIVNGPTDYDNDCAAIYTKCIRGIIANNYVKNWGVGEASINVKGQPRNHTQLLTITGATNGVTQFKLYDSANPTHITGTITYDSNLTTLAGTIQTALESVSGIGAGNVSVTLTNGTSAGKVFSIEYVGALAGLLSGPVLTYQEVTGPGTYSFGGAGLVPRGYGMQVIGNSLYCDNTYTYSMRGIKISCEDSDVRGNICEGFREGITSSSGDVIRNWKMEGNTIKNGVAKSAEYVRGICLASNATGVRIRNNDIINMTASGAVAYGVVVSRTGDDVVIEGGVIDGLTGSGTDTAIAVNEDNEAAAAFVRIAGVCIRNCDRGIRFVGSATYAEVIDCDIATTVTTPTVWTVTPTSLLIRGIRGIVTQTCGVAVIANGTTSIAVTHGITGLPTGKLSLKHVMVNFGESPGSSAKFWVTSVGDTQFTINVNADPAQVGGADMVWQVNVIGAV
jgi:hypothetical protein